MVNTVDCHSTNESSILFARSKAVDTSAILSIKRKTTLRSALSSIRV